MGSTYPLSHTSMSPTNNPWFAATMLLSGLIVGYAVASALDVLPQGAAVGNNNPPVAAQPNPTPPAPTPPPPAEDVPEVTDSDHIRGDADAQISVIEYSDFECPFCKRHHPTMEKVVADYDGKVNWVYRHFPLSFHPNAMPSAIASECAAKIGGNDAFWEYADALIETDTYDFEQIAADVGLNATAFKSCLDDEDGSMEKLVTAQADAGGAAGVGGTPGNFIMNNDTGEAFEVSGAVPFNTFKTQIDKMLE